MLPSLLRMKTVILQGLNSLFYFVNILQYLENKFFHPREVPSRQIKKNVLKFSFHMDKFSAWIFHIRIRFTVHII